MYILTFNNESHLNSGLTSMFSGNLSNHDLQVFIINNHSNFHLHDEFKDKVTVLHNALSSDFSLGNTSRSWNQALIHGFIDLNTPDCDLVILAQDDCEYGKDWLNLVYSVHFEMGYHFFCVGAGDMLHSYTPTAIKKVGLWDERYSALSFMEHDYFIRCAMHLGDRATVSTGHGMGYALNPIQIAQLIATNPVRIGNKRELQIVRTAMDHPSRQLFAAKWGDVSEHIIVSNFANKPRKPGIPEYILYPHFEKNVENLAGLGYFFTTWSRS